MTWDLEPGAQLPRAAIHARFGGRVQPRISPSKTSQSVLLFLTPGAHASWHDGWTGVHVHFGGEGGVNGGDQNLKQGNGTILRHQQDGRALRLFLQPPIATHPTRYVGQYTLDPSLPYVRADASADPRQPLETRRIVVFRLLPLDGPPTGLPIAQPVAEETTIREVDVATARPRQGALRTVPSQAAESKLLLRYEEHARWASGSTFVSYRITDGKAVTDKHVDRFDQTLNELVIARASTSQPSIWQAIGELHDLVRYFPAATGRTLVLPHAPDTGLAELLGSQGITATWPTGTDGFTRATTTP